MENIVKYNGYKAFINTEFENDEKIFVGKVIGINSSVSFYANKETDIIDRFKEAIMYYFGVCDDLNRKPEKTNKLLMLKQEIKYRYKSNTYIYLTCEWLDKYGDTYNNKKDILLQLTKKYPNVLEYLYFWSCSNCHMNSEMFNSKEELLEKYDDWECDKCCECCSDRYINNVFRVK